MIGIGDDFILEHNHKVVIQDSENGMLHSVYVRLNNKLLFQYVQDCLCYYSEESSQEDAPKIYINYIEDSENAESIYVRALKTFCWICHQKFHSEQQVDYYDVNGNLKGYLTPCSRCGGAGFLPQYYYYQGGICFKCNGARYQELSGTH